MEQQKQKETSFPFDIIIIIITIIIEEIDKHCKKCVKKSIIKVERRRKKDAKWTKIYVANCPYISNSKLLIYI